MAHSCLQRLQSMLLLGIEACKMLMLLFILSNLMKPDGSIIREDMQPGHVKINVSRVVSDRTLIDADEPLTLMLEVEINGKTKTRMVTNDSTGIVMDFYPVDYTSALMFRIRDNNTSFRAVRGSLILLPCELKHGFIGYKAGNLGVIVMRVWWLEIKDTTYY